jgi:hypothetical protein
MQQHEKVQFPSGQEITKEGKLNINKNRIIIEYFSSTS